MTTPTSGGAVAGPPADLPAGAAGAETARDSEDAGGTGTDLVPFRTAVGVWFRVSLQTFGGPAGQIAVMHRVLVYELRWVGERRLPDWSTVSPRALAGTALAAWLLFRRTWGVLPTLGVTALVGGAIHLVANA